MTHKALSFRISITFLARPLERCDNSLLCRLSKSGIVEDAAPRSSSVALRACVVLSVCLVEDLFSVHEVLEISASSGAIRFAVQAGR